jgi:hypothetical protein
MFDCNREHVANFLQAERLLGGEQNRFQNQFKFHWQKVGLPGVDDSENFS